MGRTVLIRALLKLSIAEDQMSKRGKAQKVAWARPEDWNAGFDSREANWAEDNGIEPAFDAMRVAIDEALSSEQHFSIMANGGERY